MPHRVVQLSQRGPAIGRGGTNSGPATSAVPGSSNAVNPEGLPANPNLDTTGDKMLELTSQPISPPPPVGLFAGFGKTLLDRGIDFHGLAFDHPDRPSDALGLQAKYQKLGSTEVANESFKQGSIHGRGRRQRGSNYACEIVGNIQVTPAIAFPPTVDYFVKPGNYYPRRRAGTAVRMTGGRPGSSRSCRWAGC